MKTPTAQTQVDLETLYNKWQLISVLREEFKSIVNYEDVENRLGIDGDFIVDTLVQIYLHRQADPETMVGILGQKYDNHQNVANCLLTLVHEDYLDYDPETERFIVKFDISDDVKAMVDLYQYPLPMVVKPQRIVNNFDSGYHTIHTPVVLNGSSYFDDKDLCLDHLNRANSVALTLNFETVKSAEGKFVKPTRQIGEDFDEFQKKCRQANVFYTTSVEAMEKLNELTDEIYLTHRYDRRGRVYASGYHISTQGDDYRKAVLNLAKKELING